MMLEEQVKGYVVLEVDDFNNIRINFEAGVPFFKRTEELFGYLDIFGYRKGNTRIYKAEGTHDSSPTVISFEHSWIDYNRGFDLDFKEEIAHQELEKMRKDLERKCKDV